jgi:hypothetical protein
MTNTFTASPTLSLTPSQTPTMVPVCTSITGSALRTSDNTMTMTIRNPYSWPLTTGDGSVTWNYVKGHKTGNDKTLNLMSIEIAGTMVWNLGPTTMVSTQPFTTPAVIPANSTVTIVFTFDKSYDNMDEYESVLINLGTHGCEGKFIQSP